jgi:diguanylate cyclase (GGDEF)-like protein/PAS domain S-box-containing protein/putative nucleotidyltransferase with HDIG domain
MTATSSTTTDFDTTPKTGDANSLSMVRESTGPAAGSQTDMSRILLALMQVAHRGVPETPEDVALEGVIKAETLRALLSALHLRDVGTMQHARRVAQLATGLAQFLGWEGRHLKLIEVAGLLHDIGKIGVPDTVLHKPGALGPDEAALMGLHHNICIDVLQAAGLDSEVIAIVGQAREKFGSASGVYRRPGEPMHMGARILAVADAYDAIRCDWIYRDAKTHEATLDILREHSGTQFDGNIVSALQRWTKESGDPLGVQIEMDLTQATGALSEESIRVHHDISLLQRAFSYLYMLESLYDGFYIVDSDLRISVWNSGIERMLGYTATEMVQKNWTSRALAYADEKDKPLPEAATPMGQVLASLRPVTVTTRIQHVDGRWLNVEAYTVPLIDSQGRIQGIAEIFRDTSRSSRRPLEYHELRMAATRDAMTGVCNRGELETQLALLVAGAVKTNWTEPFSVIFADVDHFKNVNDSFGHAVGDKVLVEFAKLLQHETYSGEIVGRYGGEEFVILCPGTDLAQATKRADRIRLSISKLDIEGLYGQKITSSFGVSQSESGDSVDSVLRRADEGMYAAKHGGRNRVVARTRAEADAKRTKPAQPKTDRFCYEGNFLAVITSDMVVYKLGGFVCDEQGRLLEVTPNRALVQVGRKGWFSSWGSTDDKQPVDVEISFTDKQVIREVNGRKVRTPQVDVIVRIRPLGTCRKQDVFEARARRVYKRLLSYFAAEAVQG